VYRLLGYGGADSFMPLGSNLQFFQCGRCFFQNARRFPKTAADFFKTATVLFFTVAKVLIFLGLLKELSYLCRQIKKIQTQ